jgi:hypothetical protein
VLDYAIGSALECAACLDIAQIKEFLCPDETLQEKSSLCEVVKMMVGLKKAWSVEAFRKRGGPGRNVCGALHAHGQA